MSQSVGPLGAEVSVTRTGVRRRSGRGAWKGANALVLLRRTAFVTYSGDTVREIDKEATAALLKWAEQQHLGQDAGLLADVLARRERALKALHAGRHTVVRLRARPQWRLVVGMGARENAYEIGLALHGTYGVPVIPGSTVKGLTAAWAQETGQDSALMDTVFGAPRPGRPGTPRQGAVRFLDALPLQTAKLARDVLTPHAQPYYRSTDTGESTTAPTAVAPAEHHNPIPVPFLTVRGTRFAVDLTGRDPEAVEQAAAWCTQACDALGAGAKTATGYGYLAVDRDETWPRAPHHDTNGTTNGNGNGIRP
ncbi:type III-B CRISPR module RAMP protein Cmr6 [Streptomyces sp. NPDC049910]|uniref:type III-B CRISPR module RAMP protein Cmr6 n=1 Tax=Streptomyces sp. NPDC049910 TaxID=3155278 RepID=UPI0034298C0E